MSLIFITETVTGQGRADFFSFYYALYDLRATRSGQGQVRATGQGRAEKSAL